MKMKNQFRTISVLKALPVAFVVAFFCYSTLSCCAAFPDFLSNFFGSGNTPLPVKVAFLFAPHWNLVWPLTAIIFSICLSNISYFENFGGPEVFVLFVVALIFYFLSVYLIYNVPFAISPELSTPKGWPIFINALYLSISSCPILIKFFKYRKLAESKIVASGADLEN